MRAIAAGRLRACLTPDGRRIVDVALADQEWAANTDLSRAPDEVKARAAQSAHEHGKLAQEQGKPAHSMGESAQTGDYSDAAALATASAREKHFRAKLAELKYAERAGQLIDAAEVKAQIIDMITIARTKLLGLPSKAKQRLPHLSLEDLATLDAIVREALEELVPPPATAAQGAAA